MNSRNWALLLALTAMLPNAGFADNQNCYWIFLRDKGIAEEHIGTAIGEAQASLTAKCIERRAKSAQTLADFTDVPVYKPYVEALREAGCPIRYASRWLNAVSIEVNPDQLEQIRTLPFVLRIQPFAEARPDIGIVRARESEPLDDPNYGPSFVQNELSRIPELHQRGLSGQGILICFLDTGFDLSHHAFDSLQVEGTYDFIFGDSIVSDEIGQDTIGQEIHGTAVLSTAVGYADSLLIGPAFGARVLCAKTEWVASETPIEEDYFVAGLEWADSLGADIVSSSLGYSDWYQFEDLDGHTAVTTLGVTIAARHGILVVVAAGNQRLTEWGHLLAPADADSILACGAIDTTLGIAYFSSPGPTADGRIKPDVCALGLPVFCADGTGPNRYFSLSGTSFSTPLIAGVAALVMEAHPDWPAQLVREALMSTASNADNPNNDFGWGIVDAVQSADYVPDRIGDAHHSLPNAIRLSFAPNPTNGRVLLTLAVTRGGKGRLGICDLLGRERLVMDNSNWIAGNNEVSLDLAGWASGIYLARFEGTDGLKVQRLILLK